MPDTAPKIAAARPGVEFLATLRRFLRMPVASSERTRPISPSISPLGTPAGGRKRFDPRDAEPQSMLSYIIQGGVFIGVLLLLFVLAGFRG